MTLKFIARIELLPGRMVRSGVLPLLLAGTIICGFISPSAAQGANDQKSVAVRDFGAIPGDGACDAAAINAAIRHAQATNAEIVQFEAGTYNLRYEEGTLPTILLHGATDLTLRGAVDATGEPTTVLELNLPLRNEFGVRHLDCRDGRNIALENLVFDLDPPFSTSGQVIAVDRDERVVTVEIFPGMPHFEGMKCFSANSWDLETRDLLPVDPLTINMREPYFENLWHRVEDPDKVIYAIRNMPFTDTVQVGDGISWHFSVVTTHGFNLAFNTIDGLSLHNLRIHNSITLSAKTYDSRDITITDVRIEPKGHALAVGPRDGIHISNPRGRLLVDGLYVKGVRWDPLVSRVNFVTVREVNGNRLECTYRAVGNPDTIFQVGDMVDFWSGEKPFRMQVTDLTVLSRRGEKRFLLEFDREIPDHVTPGSLISPPTWDEAVIRNSWFEGNCGTAIVYENTNLIVENNVFRNNTYNAIGIGPTSLNTGAFGNGIIIRNNLFSGGGWVSKYGKNHGIITTFQQHPHFTHEAYNSNILIENNFFKDLDYNDQICAIHIKNAQDVVIRNNHYINVPRKVVVDEASTANIAW